MIQPEASMQVGTEPADGNPRYPLPWAVGVRLVWSALRGRRRSFQEDARSCVTLLHPPLHVLGAENIPMQGPILVTANHYSRAGFQGWWIPLAINACLSFDLHWVMTDAWRFEGHSHAQVLERLTRWGFRRVAHVYAFTSMPSMPPREHETQARAQAVRHLLRYARQTENPTIGLVPEGYNIPGGLLGRPPDGVGRLIAHLVPYTRRILPVAVYETQGRLCLYFGEPYTMHDPLNRDVENIERFSTDTVMHAIALLLPFHLRGAYS